MSMSKAPGHIVSATGKNFHDHSFFHFISYFKWKAKSVIQPNSNYEKTQACRKK